MKSLRPGKLFIISAPSGAGKTTLIHTIIEKLSKNYSLKRLVTYTSRPIRPGEKNGKDYHFLSVNSFEQKITEGFFIEWSKVYGTYYGSPTYALDRLNEGISFLVALDRLGAENVSKTVKKAVLIWIYTHNYDTLKRRLISRGSDNSEAIAYRMNIAQSEVEKEQKNRLYHHHILNDDIKKAATLLELIIKKEISSK